jgi:hypothetical protein
MGSRRRRTDILVAAPLSNTDAFLVAIPMVLCLFIAFFRLDELVVKPRKQWKIGRSLSDWDEDGFPVCTDPGGIAKRVSRRRN